MIRICWGSTRVVVVSAGLAVKFPRSEIGRRCNMFEQEIWSKYKNHPTRARHLCPVLWCESSGNLLVMPAAHPLEDEFDPRMWLSSTGKEWWDYLAGDDDADPTESKARDWGMLDGNLVAVDYATGAM